MGSRGFTTHPSAPERLARKTSAPPVEEHEHGHVGEVAVGLLQAQLEADGHATHVPHLQVDDDEVGFVLVDGGGHGVAGVDLDDLGVGVAHHGDDLGPHRGGVAGHQDRAHGGQANGCAERPAR